MKKNGRDEIDPPELRSCFRFWDKTLENSVGSAFLYGWKGQAG